LTESTRSLFQSVWLAQFRSRFTVRIFVLDLSGIYGRGNSSVCRSACQTLPPFLLPDQTCF